MAPASTASHSFSTLGWPVLRSTFTRAQQATQVGMSRSWPKVVAIPRPVSLGSLPPQPAALATRAITAAWRLAPPTAVGGPPALRPAPSNSLSRKASGS